MLRWILPVLVLGLWEIGCRLAPGSFLVASPSQIASYWQDNSGLLWRAVRATTTTAALGFLWGNLAAILLAGLVQLAPRFERFLLALALLLFCLPLVATGPILRVLFGPGDGPQITLAALAVYYTSFLTLSVGLRAIPDAWADLIRIYGRSDLTMLLTIRARAALPYLITALQIAAPAAFLGAMIGEFTGSERGLGVLTLRAMRSLNVEATWTLAITSASISIAVYLLLGWIGRKLGHEPVILLARAQAPQQHNIGASLTFVTGVSLTVLALWHVSMEVFELNRFFAKRPLDVWSFLMTAPEAAQNRAILLKALGETFALTLPGYFTGLALGVGLACLLVLAPLLHSTALPLAIALRSVPIITTAPLLILALGRGAIGTISIIAVMIFFPTLAACLQGLRQTPGQIVDVFQSHAAGRWRLLLWVRLPAMLPAFFASARMAVPAALLAVTTTEWLATGKGIGTLMALTATTSNYAMLWSSILVLSLIAVLLYACVARVERTVLSQYASEQVTR